MTEREFQNAVVKLARVYGFRVMHTRPAMMRSGRWSTPLQGDPGWPDLVLCGRGRVLFRELKVGRNKLEPDQEAWRDTLVAAGCDWKLWTLADWPDVVQTDLALKVLGRDPGSLLLGFGG